MTGAQQRVRAAGCWAALAGALACLLLLTVSAAVSMMVSGDWLRGPFSQDLVGDVGALHSIYAILLPLLWLAGLVWGALFTWLLRRAAGTTFRAYVSMGAVAGVVFGALMALTLHVAGGAPLVDLVANGISVAIAWIIGMWTYGRWRTAGSRSAPRVVQE